MRNFWRSESREDRCRKRSGRDLSADVQQAVEAHCEPPSATLVSRSARGPQPLNREALDGEIHMESCPCCSYRTLTEKAAFEICPVCFWEDDGQGDENADDVLGGPNGQLSLTAARANFMRFGAADERFRKNVRPPSLVELP